MPRIFIYIGVNISERKSGTERTKKRQKRELVFFTTRGATGTGVHRLDRPNSGYLHPGPTRPGLNRHKHNILQTHTWHDKMVILYYEMQFQNNRTSFAERWKQVAESSEFHWTLSRAHRARFSDSKYATQKAGQAGKRDGAKKKPEFTRESGNVDTYVFTWHRSHIPVFTNTMFASHPLQRCQYHCPGIVNGRVLIPAN